MSEEKEDKYKIKETEYNNKSRKGHYLRVTSPKTGKTYIEKINNPESISEREGIVDFIKQRDKDSSIDKKNKWAKQQYVKGLRS